MHLPFLVACIQHYDQNILGAIKNPYPDTNVIDRGNGGYPNNLV